MKFNRIIAGLVMTSAATVAWAQPEGVTENSMISKVDTVYVREAKGLYIEKSLLRHFEGKQLWVNVRLASIPLGESVSELFRVPADLAIERGDLVATRIGDKSALNMKLLPEINRVTQLVAKSDTLMAMTFGAPKSQPVPNIFLEAKAH